MDVKSTNRTWQKHLKAKGIIPFFLDRLQSHALSSAWQFEKGPFHFPISDREAEDELSRAYFEYVEHFPYAVYIEVTNHCNLNCKMCARKMLTRPKGVMDMALFEKIVDEIAEKQPHAYLHYYGIGDPLMDKHILTRLRYAADKGLTNSALFTNGQLLFQNDIYKALLDLQPALLGLDLDGFSPGTYNQIRVGGEFAVAKQAAEALYAYARENRLRTRVEISYQIYPGVNEHEIEPFVAWCEANDYEYNLVPMHTWGGLRADIPRNELPGFSNNHRGSRVSPCPEPFRTCFIAWDGRVGRCFQDADLRSPQGDLRTQSIEAVWTGPMRALRREHLNGQFGGICADCDSCTNIMLPAPNSRLYPDSLR
ncbi:radical SAM/SPASM domain-containing protein [Solidesulfovibrio sp.]